MNLPTGPTAGIRVSGTDSRGQYFCGVAAMLGTPPKDALLFMSYPVSRELPADVHTKIDTEKLGEELGAQVGVNAARFVTCDEMSYLSSETVDFQGVKCAWVETMDVQEMSTRRGCRCVPTRPPPSPAVGVRRRPAGAACLLLQGRRACARWRCLSPV
jgi:hypothetical protein